MPFPGGTYLAQIIGTDNWVYRELDQFYSLLQGWLSVEHDEDGHHTDVTADSITVAGDVAADTGTFDGDVTADADGEPIVLEADSVLGPGLALRGTNSQWRIAASGSADTLTIRDEGETANTATIDIVKTAAGPATAYAVRPHSSAVALSLGTDASGQRWSEVNASTVRADVFAIRARSAPAQITSDRNDYAINGLGRVFINADAAHDITGIIAGISGEILWITNNGVGTVTIKNNSASSVAGNRIACPNGLDIALGGTNTSVLLQYDSTFAFWFVLGV